jgi:hypothetical protein
VADRAREPRLATHRTADAEVGQLAGQPSSELRVVGKAPPEEACLALAGHQFVDYHLEVGGLAETPLHVSPNTKINRQRGAWSFGEGQVTCFSNRVRRR